jgi:uncharacterized protein
MPLTLAATLGAPAARAQPPAPRIDQTFPPPHDVRRPDRSTPAAGAGAVRLLAFPTSGRSLATSGSDGVVRVWNARTGSQPAGALEVALEPAPARVLAGAFTYGDGGFTGLSADGTVITWQFPAGKAARSAVLQTADGLPVRPDLAVLHPGTEPLLAVAAARSLALFSDKTGKQFRAFAPAPRRTRALAFRVDGKVLAAGDDRGTIRLWDVATAAPLRTLEARLPVHALALSATHLAAAGAGGTIVMWSLEQQEPPQRWRTNGAIEAMAVSPKSDLLATSAGRTVQVWDVASGELLCTQTGHSRPVVAVAFNPNGQKMVAGDAGGTVHTFTVPLPPLPAEALDRIAAALPVRALVAPRKPRKLLVFWRADAILHKGGVPAANRALELLGARTGAFVAHFSRDYEVFDRRVLSRYDALVLNSTAHIVLPDEEKKRALLDWVRAGGGVVGIHAAIDMFKSWPEGAEVVGATFGGHPWGPSGTWAVKLADPKHPLLRAWGGQPFKMKDEFYELDAPYRRSDRRVLLSLDLSDAATAGVKPLHRQDRDFAVSWIKSYGAGRVFYGMFGHIADPFWDPRVLTFYLDGIQYALGDLQLPPEATAAPATN